MSLDRIILALALAMMGTSEPHASSGADLDRQLAREPAEVTLANGRSVRGLLDGFREGRLHLRLATDGGEVGYSFASSELARLVLPGTDWEGSASELLERGDVAAAMPLLEALGRHRIRYLPILDAERQRVLWDLVEHAAASSDPDAVRGILRAMTAVADTKEKQLALVEAEVFLALGVPGAPEVEPLARRWCSLADPAGRSALGWRVLARRAYDAGDDDQARWIALQPVTFSSHVGMRELDLCYAIAIAAADRQGDVAHAHALRGEMQARQLPWPADLAFAGVGAHYIAGDPPPRIAFSATALPSKATKPASFDDARKLPRSLSPP